MTKEQERCVTEFLMWWLMTYGGEPVARERLSGDEHCKRFYEYRNALASLGTHPPAIAENVFGDGFSKVRLNAWAWGLLQREEI